MVERLFFRFRVTNSKLRNKKSLWVTNMKLINEKSSLNISLNVREPLEIDTTPYISKNLLQ